MAKLCVIGYRIFIWIQEFVWGLDIREWHRHLNPLTWSDVLHQFALAAGFGPQWKKCKSVQERIRDENEVKHLIILTLKNS